MDMVTMNIIESAMVAICREMGVNVQKTAYSTIFSEAEDFTCALASPEGEMIAVAEFCPAQIGGVPLLVRSMAKEIPLSDIDEGDVIIHNDPYRGGLHTPEHTMFKPIFVGGELTAFAVAIGHFVEVGGMVPGGFPGEATEIFHEGLRVPPVKIVKRGEDVPEVWKLLLANVRTPRGNYGDLRALISAVDLGESRLKDLVEKYGKQVFRQTVEDLMDYSEARMRAEIAAFPDGTYSFEDGLEDDGIEDKEYTIKVTVHVQGDEVVIDYTGSSPQAKGPINATLGVAWSASFNAMLNLTDDSIPRNSGCFRPIQVIAPAGTIMNVDYPGSEVGGNTETHPLIVAVIFGALADAVPDRAAASEGTTHGCFVFGGWDERNQHPFGAFDFTYVGYGGRSFADGNDATDSINGNCANTPTEVFETRYPWLVEEYALRPDSGGPGEYRGGLSITKRMVCTDTEVTISQMTNKHKKHAWGLNGGKPGVLGATLYLPRNGERWQTIAEAFGKISPSKYSNVPILPGERVIVAAPGGGGYGDPAKRDPRAVVEDVREGYVTVKAAKRDYGFEDSWLSRYGDAATPKAAE
jgi:N-methylhydantoinase B/oxoprolinase/acetone carboxylase alpha subunit